MPYTQAQIDALRVAIASGVQRVNYNGRDVTYASLDKMLQVLRVMEDELATANGMPVVRRSYARFTKG